MAEKKYNRVSLQIDPELGHKFQLWCLSHKVSYKDQTEFLVSKFMLEEERKEKLTKEKN